MFYLKSFHFIHKYIAVWNPYKENLKRKKIYPGIVSSRTYLRDSGNGISNQFIKAFEQFLKLCSKKKKKKTQKKKKIKRTTKKNKTKKKQQKISTTVHNNSNNKETQNKTDKKEKKKKKSLLLSLQAP